VRRRRQTVLVALVVLLGGVATSCFQAAVGLEVADDGSGQLVLDLVPSPQLLDALGGDLPTLAAQLRTVATAQSSAAVVEVNDTPEGEALHVELPFTDITALTADAGSANGGLTGTLLGGVVQELQVVERDGVWSMVAVLDPGATEGGVLSSPLAAAAGLDTQPKVTFSVTLPGRVDSSNATSTSGGTATWTLDTAATSPQTLRMVNSPVAVLPLVLGILGGGPAAGAGLGTDANSCPCLPCWPCLPCSPRGPGHPCHAGGTAPGLVPRPGRLGPAALVGRRCLDRAPPRPARLSAVTSRHRPWPVVQTCRRHTSSSRPEGAGTVPSAQGQSGGSWGCI